LRFLIVTADDFGYSSGINKGIIDGHNKGIITSTSVMVDGIAGSEAGALMDLKDLSVGLHLVLKDFNHIENELSRQIEKFKAITGRGPDHIDTHKMLPTDNKRLQQVLTGYSRREKTPVRSLGFAKFIDSFFGFNVDGSGELNEQNVSLAALKSAVDEATDEYNELMCHAGYSDDYLRKNSSYNDTRQRELETLTNPAIKQYIQSKGLKLSDWNLVRQVSTFELKYKK
jgi:chitin disaccharide deacetylase